MPPRPSSVGRKTSQTYHPYSGLLKHNWEAAKQRSQFIRSLDAGVRIGAHLAYCVRQDGFKKTSWDYVVLPTLIMCIDLVMNGALLAMKGWGEDGLADVERDVSRSEGTGLIPISILISMYLTKSTLSHTESSPRQGAGEGRDGSRSHQPGRASRSNRAGTGPTFHS